MAMEKTFWYWFGCSAVMANSVALMLFGTLWGNGLELVVGVSIGAVGSIVACWLLLRVDIPNLRARPPVTPKASQSQLPIKSLHQLLKRFPLF